MGGRGGCCSNWRSGSLFEPRFLVVASAIDPSESAAGLEILTSVTIPNTTKYIAATGKVSSGNGVKSFKIEANYPPELPSLQTLAAWAGFRGRSGHRFRDGADLFCLREILKKESGFDFAVLLRESVPDGDCGDLSGILEGMPFASFHLDADGNLKKGGKNVLFDLRRPDGFSLLDLAFDLHATGAVYAMKPYSLDVCLGAVADALPLILGSSADEVAAPQTGLNFSHGPKLRDLWRKLLGEAR